MRVLIADAEPKLVDKLDAALTRWGFETRPVADGAAAWAALQDADAIDLALLGADVPGMDGIQICRALRAQPRARPLYVLLLLGDRGGGDDFGAALRAGADDGIWRPIDARELQARLYLAQRHLRTQTTIASLQDALRVQSMNDALTGLWNHGAILDMASRELSRAVREGTATSVVLVDVDHFRSVNDSYGHAAGDVVLREVGRRVRASVRSYDGVGRFGGDVTMIVLPRCEERDAINLAERIRASVADAPINTGVARVPVTVSIGLATASAAFPVEVRELVGAADAALQKVKAEGRNRVVTAS